MGLVKVEIIMLRGYISCEHLMILTCKLGSKTIVLRYFINCKLHSLCKSTIIIYDGLHTVPKHVVLYYISLLIIILLCFMTMYI